MTNPDTLAGGVKLDVDALAQEIRRIDGDNTMGAGALAEHIVLFLAALPATGAVEGDLTAADYEASMASHLAHVLDLDVEMNGDGAAKRPLLIDIKAQLIDHIRRAKTIRDDIKCECVGQHGPNPECGKCGGSGCYTGLASPPSPSEGEPFLTGRGWENLSCDDQFTLATQIAANIGYDLIAETEHPDSPHNTAHTLASPPKPSEAMVEAAARKMSEGLYGGTEGWVEYQGIARDALTAALSGGAK